MVAVILGLGLFLIIAAVLVIILVLRLGRRFRRSLSLAALRLLPLFLAQRPIHRHNPVVPLPPRRP